jgi:peptidoglycan/xylan/chitin deacetylase (PgdA/CDA1 family)
VKQQPEPARHDVIRDLAAAVGVAVPQGLVSGYEPLKWDEIRALEREGVRFGPHTHTHPILAAVDDAQAKREIELSWERVQDEVRDPLPIFAYPNGTTWSFSARDSAMVKAAGLIAALTMDARWTLPTGPAFDAFSIGRIAFPSQFSGLQASVLQLGPLLTRVIEPTLGVLPPSTFLASKTP